MTAEYSGTHTQELPQAAQQVDEIAQQIRAGGGDPHPALQALAAGIQQFEATQYPVEDLLGVEIPESLGFRRHGQVISAQEFWNLYQARLREHMCTEEGHPNAFALAALDGGSHAFLSWLLSALGLGLAALPILVPIAAILLATGGLAAFCHKEGTH